MLTAGSSEPDSSGDGSESEGTAPGDEEGSVDAPNVDTKPENGGSGDSVSGGGYDLCIDARALRHLRAEYLVFEKHAWVHVLCDANESCSTAGRRVVFHGKTVMMENVLRLGRMFEEGDAC